MRDIILSIFFLVGLSWSITSPSVALVVLNWIWFQRPYDFSWGVWNQWPMFQIAFAVALLSNMLWRKFRFYFPPLLLVYLALLGWLTLSVYLAYDNDHAWWVYKTFLPSMWIAPVLLFATIHDLGLLKKLLWVSAGGIGFNACKVGLIGTLKGGTHLQDQISGFVGDNNVFGLVLCLVLAVLMGLRTTLPSRWQWRALFYIGIGLIILCVLYTQSRGALLTLVIIFVSSSLLSGKSLRYTLLLIVLAGVGYQILPEQSFSRLSTLRNVDADQSALGRLENWELSWREAVRYPWFGVGPDNHLIYNKSMPSKVQVRVAHSVYFQILGELGFPALGLYMVFMGLGLGGLMRTWRMMIPIAKVHPDLIWVRDTSFWMSCGYMGYLFGSGLLNMFYIEFPWYAMFYGSLLGTLARRELASRTDPARALNMAKRPGYPSLGLTEFVRKSSRHR